jgi:hypothetical protein
MGKGHKFSGLTEKTPQSIQVGAGVFCVNVPEFDEAPSFEDLIKVVEDASSENRVLGATRGGGTFVASLETSIIEIDDMKYPLEGTVEITGQEARFTGTTVELKKETMKLILPMSHEDEKHGGLTMSSMLLPSHYIKNVLWIGNMTSGGATAIMIYKALNTDGVTLTFTESGGATMPFNYTAHQPDPSSVQFAPFHIWFVAAPEDLDPDPDPDPDPGATDITLGTPLEGMTIQQMRDFATEQTPQIDIPSNLTLRQDIAEYILTELGLI